MAFDANACTVVIVIATITSMEFLLLAWSSHRSNKKASPVSIRIQSVWCICVLCETNARSVISIVTALWTVAWPCLLTTSPMPMACHGVYGSQPAGKVPNHQENVPSNDSIISVCALSPHQQNTGHHSESSSWTHCIKCWWPGGQLHWRQSNNHSQLSDCCCWRHEDDGRKAVWLFAQSVDPRKKPTGTRSHFVWRRTKESGVIHVRWTRESEQTIKTMTVQ